MSGGDYVKQEGVADFRSAWEEMDEGTELADSYGLGQRDSMQEAVEAVIAILGMQVWPCLHACSYCSFWAAYMLCSLSLSLWCRVCMYIAALAGVQRAGCV